MRSDPSIRARLAIGFGLVLALQLMLTGITLAKIHQIDTADDDVVHVIARRVDEAVAIQTAFLNQSIAVHSYLATGDPKYLNIYRLEQTNRRVAVDHIQQLTNTKEGQRALSTMLGVMKDFDQLSSQTIQLAESRAGADRMGPLENRLRDLRGDLIEATRAYSRLQTEKRLTAAAQLDDIEHGLYNELIFFSAVILAIGIVAALLTIKAVRAPARRLIEAIGAAEQGHYDPALRLAELYPQGSAQVRNELNIVAGAFGRMAGVTRQRQARLEADSRVTAVLTSSLDPRRLAAGALAETMGFAGCEGGAIYIVDEESGRLRLLNSRALEGAEEWLDPGMGIAGQAIAGDAPLLCKAPADGPWRIGEEETSRRPAALAIVPLVFQNSTIGLMLLAGSREISGDCLEFIGHASYHLSVSLQNALTHRAATRLAEELRTSEAELRRKAAALTEADRRKDEFLAMLAHELRNPLAAISNANYVLLEGTTHPEQAARLQGIVSRQVKHLARMVDDLLDVSRITRGKVELRKEPLEFNPVVMQAIEASRGAIEIHRHQLEVDLPIQSPRLEADPTRLEQMILNLINNAVKYTESGGRIRVAAQVCGGRIELSVADNGIGIAPEILPNVFDLFAQADNGIDRAKGGLGIGLTLVRTLARLHGGEVEARSAGIGQGSEFILRLPAEGGE